ncbi:MAG TPA: protocatechuate 3,4-dioxygenase, partial [Pyrinomonadaceae bacterium]|nr:protocatechuate 3,4-dioxygenase [Pyrinomonadaceae bacterium]
RRRWLELMLATGGALATGSLSEILAQAPSRPETPNMVLGPFYPQVKPIDQDKDLTLIRGHSTAASGQVIHLKGRVLDRRGQPVRNARVELWQTNSYGRYAHRSDPNINAPLDPNFQGFGVQLTDREGRFQFKTVKPGPYPSREGTWMRAPHIHFDIQGRVDRKVTQLFFPNERLNDQDRLLQTVRGDRNALMASVEAVGSLGAPSELLVRWDIILASG